MDQSFEHRVILDAIIKLLLFAYFLRYAIISAGEKLHILIGINCQQKSDVSLYSYHTKQCDSKQGRFVSDN